MISCLFSLYCQRPQIAAFVCLKAPFDTPVHPFVLLLCHNSSLSAVNNSCLFGFVSSMLFSVSAAIHSLWLVFLVPRTSLHVDVTTPFILCHLTLQVSSSISFCRTWNLLESVMLNSTRLLVSFRRKVYYPKRWFFLSVHFLLNLSFNRATRRWWSEARSAPRLTRTS